MVNEVYSPEEVEIVLDMIRDNPNSFLRMAKKYAPGTVDNAKRSMRAWGIPYTEKVNEEGSSNRTSRSR